MRKTTTALAVLLALSAAGGARAEDDAPRFTVGGILDARFIRTDTTRSWLDAGLGKARWGSLVGGEEAELARLAQASLLLDAALGEVVQAHVQIRTDAEPDAFLKRGKTGLVEAFATWRPELSPAVRLKARAGLFFPPISLEHPLKGWTTAYTITPSAVNAWIGEEIRTAGLETNLVLKVAKDNEITATGAVFGMNDPVGSALAWRGWAMHDRTSITADELPFAAFPMFRPGGTFATSAPWVSPIREVDGRLGWYAGGSWRWPSVLDARALHYDNRGQPDVFDGRQYAWQAEFTNLGLRLELPGTFELLGQHLYGTSGMGVSPTGGLNVDIEYQASYALLTARAGRHRFSVRYDRFEVEDRDLNRVEDNNTDDGEAWTAAYLLQTGGHHRLALEWMRITGDHPQRVQIGLPVHAEEDLIQASFRVMF
jgi:hypothetical protein